MMEYEEWVKDFPKDWEREPFCPFPGPNKVGYCNVAYTDHCVTCPEALAAYDAYCAQEDGKR
jgi:hypothetical protein